MPKTYPSIGVQTPALYLPRAGVDPSRWAVVACDQFTSQPEYWRRVEQIVGDAPSTLNLTLPEVYLGKPGEEKRIQNIQANMRRYLEEGLLERHDGMLYVERTVDGKKRKGLVLSLDLECYDYNKGASSLVRATEGTIVDRLPPRMKIREGAPLEFPHILVLIDDPERTVIEPLAAAKDRMVPRYGFDLMLDSGRLDGWQIQDEALEAQVIAALEALASPAAFARKYNLDPSEPVFLFAMGDGNHSLATAKAIWEKLKPHVGPDHPARYALVEIENVHDEGIEVEPIYRVLFDLKPGLFAALRAYYGPQNVNYYPVEDCVQMMAALEAKQGGCQAVGLTFEHHFGVIEIANPTANLAVGTLQPFLDHLIQSKQAAGIDYVHGKCVVCKLTGEPGNYGFFFPSLAKSDLFKTVILDGALPRKTFSMGEPRAKRFYFEARRIA